MKRYVVVSGAFMVVLVAAWAAFGQREGGRTSSARGIGRGGFPMFQVLSPEEAAKVREQWPNMSEEEREKLMAKMREKWEAMSDEEREKLRDQMRERFGSGRGGFARPEDQQEAIKAIEAQLAKLKAGTQMPRPQGGFQDLSEDERAKLREQMTKARQDRQQALQTIIAQVARLQGRRAPDRQGAQYLIISTSDLKPIQEAAVKEKAKETAQLIERLMARGSGARGFGGGRAPGSGQRPGGGTRGPRRPGTEGGQRGSGRPGTGR